MRKAEKPSKPSQRKEAKAQRKKAWTVRQKPKPIIDELQAEYVKRGPGHPTDYKPEYCDLVLREMTKGYSLGGFAGLIPVERRTVSNWMKQHPEFFLAVLRGKVARLRQWETAAMKSAFTQEGGNATMIQFGLKNAGSEDWADKQEITLAHDIRIESLTEHQLTLLVERLAASEGAGESTGTALVPIGVRTE